MILNIALVAILTLGLSSAHSTTDSYPYSTEDYEYTTERPTRITTEVYEDTTEDYEYTTERPLRSTTEDYEYTTERPLRSTTEEYEYTTNKYPPYTTEEYPYTTTPSPDLCFVPGEVTGVLLGAVSSPDFDECIDICAETAGCSWEAIQWHNIHFS